MKIESASEGSSGVMIQRGDFYLYGIAGSEGVKMG